MKKTVQMNFDERTMEALNKLIEETGITNKTRLVTSAIKLTELITSSIKQNKKVVIEDLDGEREVIKLIGL